MEASKTLANAAVGSICALSQPCTNEGNGLACWKQADVLGPAHVFHVVLFTAWHCIAHPQPNVSLQELYWCIAEAHLIHTKAPGNLAVAARTHHVCGMYF
jgi:hypothetical protein